MKAVVLALAFAMTAGITVRAEGGTRPRHAPIVIPSSGMRCAALVTHRATRSRSPVRWLRRVYRPRRGDFGFF